MSHQYPDPFIQPTSLNPTSISCRCAWVYSTPGNTPPPPQDPTQFTYLHKCTYAGWRGEFQGREETGRCTCCSTLSVQVPFWLGLRVRVTRIGGVYDGRVTCMAGSTRLSGSKGHPTTQPPHLRRAIDRRPDIKADPSAKDGIVLSLFFLYFSSLVIFFIQAESAWFKVSPALGMINTVAG